MRAATHNALPDDVAALRALVIDLHTRLQSRDDALQAREAQLELLVEDAEASAPLSTPAAVVPRPPASKPVRKPLPEHLPRETVIHSPADACPDCGTPMRRIGEDVSEMLEYVPARFN